jgi:hypothetical protein
MKTIQTHVAHFLPIDVTKVIIHHISAKAGTHLHGARSGPVENGPTLFRGFTFHSANTFGEVEGECLLTFHDVSRQMKFGDQKFERFALVVETQRWGIHKQSLPQIYSPLTGDIVGHNELQKK